MRRAAGALALAVAALAVAAAAASAALLTPLYSRDGIAAGERFGAALAAPGDLDRDGRADLLVGAPDADGGRGRVELLRGGGRADTVASLVMTGGAPGDRFGQSLAALGDLDGDGWRDWAVGAPGAAAGAGRVYVFRGGPALDAVPDLVLAGAEAESLGASLAGDGDFDGDGFPDLVAGAPGVAGAAGRVLMWRGGAAPDSTPDRVFTGAPAAGTGRAVLLACDLDGDGRSDLVYGEPGWKGLSGIADGRAQVINGAAALDTLASESITGFNAYAEGLGTRLGAPGDVQGDGFDDLVVGGRYYLRLFHGGPRGSIASGSSIGARVVALERGRLRAGPDEVLCAEPDQYGPASTLDGLVYVFGVEGFATRLHEHFFGERDERTGAALAWLGDFDGDGGSDLATAALGPGAPAGRVTVRGMRGFELLYPVTGVRSLAGRPDSVTWTGREPADVEYSLDGKRTWSPVASGAGGRDTNTVVWTLPDTLTSQAYVRVRDASDPVYRAGRDATSGAFEILRLALLGPSVGTGGVPGRALEVRWLAMGPVDLDLSFGASVWRRVASAVGRAGRCTLAVALPDTESHALHLRLVTAGEPARASNSQSVGPLLLVRPRITAPAVPQDWVAGDARVVEWTSGPPVDLAYTLDDGAHWTTEGTGLVPNAGGPYAALGRRTVQVPVADSARLVFRIVATGDSLLPATSSTSATVTVRRFGFTLPTAQNWRAGESATLAWSGIGAADLDLSDDAGAVWTRVLSGVPPGSHAFTVPGTLAGATLARLTAADAAPGTGVRVYYPRPIAIRRYTMLPLTATAPRIAGDSLDVAWTGASPAALELSLDAARTWRPLVTAVGGADTNRVRVELPLQRADSAYVRVRPVGGAADAVDGDRTTVPLRIDYFQLDAGSIPSGERLALEPITLRWRGAAPADLALALDGGSAWIPLASGVGGRPRDTVTVVLPDTAGGRARVRLSVSGRAIRDTTSVLATSTFTLRSQRLLAPDGGETWQADSTHEVRWLGRVRADVELSLDDGGAWEPLARDAGGADTNRIEVVPPRFVTARARVRVRRAGAALVAFGSDTSAAPFTIRYGDVSPTPALVTHRTLRGLGNNHGLGYSLAGVGDFDGDGHPDVATGCRSALPGDPLAARVYVMPGSVGPVRMLNGRITELFGLSVAGAGDFNGDGWDDIVVGAPAASSGTTSQCGRAAVFFGGPDADSLEDLSLQLDPSVAEPYLGFGSSVAGVRDINGDGWDDIVVGSRSSLSSTGTGLVRAYFGGPGADGSPDVLFPSAGSGFGTCVTGAGDVNGDGYADVLVGAPLLSAGGPRVNLFLGGPTVSPLPALTIAPPVGAAVEYFGIALAGVGDLDDDGYDDFAVGSPIDKSAGVATGRVFLYRGARIPDGTADLTLSGAVAGGYFGAALAALGEADGDGHPDLIVGANRAYGSAAQSGLAFVYALGPGPSAVPFMTLSGQAATDQFGTAVASAGDLDGDGRSEFAVSALGRDLPFFGAGEAQVFGFAHLQVIAPAPPVTWLTGEARVVRWRGAQPADVELSLDGGASWTRLATAAGGESENTLALVVPDAPTADARVRLSMSALYPQSWTTSVSAAPIRIARPVPAAASLLEPRADRVGARAGERLGVRLAAVGDWDGDGLHDLAVGADPASPGDARVSVLLADGNRRALVAPGAGPRLGAALHAWDLDGDGALDLVAGDPHADGTAGRVLAWRGGAARDSLPAWVFTGPAADWASFGSALAFGDHDGDRVPELVVGAPDDTAGGGGGRVCVLRAGSGVPRTLLAGGVRGGRYGAALATGDLDGDGTLDLVIGAPGAGQVSVFLGGGLRPDLFVGGGQAGAGLGAALAVPGDLDGDGRDDLVVGAPRFDGPAGVDAGRAFVFLGASPLDPNADAVIDGASAGAWCGATLAGGDLDGDGFADVVVGAPFEDADRGAARVHLGGLVPDPVADAEWRGGSATARLGSALAVGAGADGLGTLALGAPFADAEAGAVRVVDWSRYRLSAPAAGARWLAGSQRRVAWRGAERAVVELTTDGGATWVTLASEAGGADSNVVSVGVPGALGSARVRVRPVRAGLPGMVHSDTFTIDRTVTLLALTAQASDEGVALRWATEPAAGPEGVAGYRLYRRAPGASGDGSRVGPDPIVADGYVDANGAPGSTYTLLALDGLGEALALGSVTVEVAVGGLVAWPVPARGGEPVRLTFVAPTDAAGLAPADLEVAVYDVAGRRVVTLARGPLATTVGRVRLDWDGRAEGGRAAAGLYFVRVGSASTGFRAERRVVLAR